jgi:predicted DNA binding protein
MTVVAEYTIPADAFFTGEVLSVDPGYTIRLVEFVPIRDGIIPYFWVENHEEGFATFEERVRNYDAVASLTALDGHTNKMLYRIEWAGQIDGLLEAFRTFDMAIEAATGTADEWQFRVFYEDHGTLSEFRQYCVDHEIPLTVERVYNPPPLDDDTAYDLTSDQLEAIRLAFDEGYFDIPRQTTMTDMGDELGISRQAVSNRLRRGIVQLLDHTIDGRE